MNEPTNEEWRKFILNRYCDEFVPATEVDATLRKTSEDICVDISGMGTFSAEEVSEYLMQRLYVIGFDDNEPVWLLKHNQLGKSLPE